MSRILKGTMMAALALFSLGSVMADRNKEIQNELAQQLKEARAALAEVEAQIKVFDEQIAIQQGIVKHLTAKFEATGDPKVVQELKRAKRALAKLQQQRDALQSEANSLRKKIAQLEEEFDNLPG